MNLKILQHELNTQDNRITENPIFVVQQKRIIAGVRDDYTTLFAWVKDGEEVDENTSKKLDRYYRRTNKEPKGFEMIGYVEIWEFVTACLTEKGCEDYLKRNGHNLNEPRIYVEGGWRNDEWEFLRNYFLSVELAP